MMGQGSILRQAGQSQLAFVLGGGGARGALQVGALRVLIQAGIVPDMLVGTSIGALNAAYLALKGPRLPGITGLERVWEDAAHADLMPTKRMIFNVHSLFRKAEGVSFQKVRRFCQAHGISASTRFGDVRYVRLYLVATDLFDGHPKIYGDNDDDYVLEGMMASAALPPWVKPIHTNGKTLMDGGVVSNLPIEPAIRKGATRIIAFDLVDCSPPSVRPEGFRTLFWQLLQTVERRQMMLEMALAEAWGVPVFRIPLGDDEPTALWDFSRTKPLMEKGYRIAEGLLPALVASLDEKESI